MSSILSGQDILLNPLIIFPLFIWITAWKGMALWKAARNSHKKWFVVLLVLNTLGILEMIYIFVLSKRKQKDSEQFKTK